MAERRRSNYGNPVILPAKYQVGRYARWLEARSIGNVPSAREFGKSLRGRDPYVVVFSEGQQKYVIYFNEDYGELDRTNAQIFSQEIEEGIQNFMEMDSSPRRKKKMLSQLKKVELQALCKKHKLRGYSKLNKSELVKLLNK